MSVLVTVQEFIAPAGCFLPDTPYTISQGGSNVAYWDSKGSTSRGPVFSTNGKGGLVDQIFLPAGTYTATAIGVSPSRPLAVVSITVPQSGAPTGKQKIATTGPAGFALTNGTPIVLACTIPNDGNIHSVDVNCCANCTQAATGGSVQIQGVIIGGSSPFSKSLLAGGSGAGGVSAGAFQQYLVDPGTVLTVRQNTALTAGAVQLFLEIWSD